MKKTLILALLIAMVALAFVGCGGTETTPTATPAPTPAEAPTATPAPTPAETPAATPAETPAETGHALVGSWDFMGLGVYYVFNADGTGIRGFEAIPDMIGYFDWTASNGILRITVTEGFGVVGFTEEWNYVIEGNQLDIDSRQVAGIEWSYTRAS